MLKFQIVQPLTAVHEFISHINPPDSSTSGKILAAQFTFGI